MAEGFPSSILDSVLKQLESPIFQSIKLNIQLQSLRSKLKFIRTVIEDAELMAFLFHFVIRKWVCDLQHVLYDVDDLLDEALTRSMFASGMLSKTCFYFYNLPFELALARKMKNINKKLESIVGECNKYNFKGILRYDPEHVKEEDFRMIGRDDDKKEVIQMLFDEDPNKAVVWIDGLPGVGKSTLCRAAYNDEEVRSHFEIRLWVSLGGLHEFSSVDLWNKIIELFGVEDPQPHMEIEEEVRLMEKIVRLIWEKKTLLVLDNLPPYIGPASASKPNFLSSLQDLVATSHKGSKILMPRPTEQIYELKDTDSVHVLNDDLSEEHCWSIFKQIAIVPGRDEAHQLPLEWKMEIGKKIVSNCEQNPAFLRGVGTLLHGSDERAAWEYFANEFYISYIDYIYATNIIFSNYHHFIGYLSLFLQDECAYEAMIQQLVANKFSNLSDTVRQRLKDEFLILVESKDNWDAKRKFKMRSKYRENVLQMAGAESAILGWTDNDLPKAARHVSIARPSSSADKQRKMKILPDNLIKDAMRRRSLLFLGELFPMRMSVQTLHTLTSNLRYLRVLDLHDLALQELPSSIGRLIHLRYLDLSRNDFKLLPGSIGNLRNLQTLKLIYCYKLIRLPGRIKKLCHLKSLEVSMCLDLTCMPSEIAGLTGLESLDRFIVGPYDGGLRYLAKLNNLKGHLSIELPQKWKKSQIDAEEANFERKKGLATLEFKWQGADNRDDENASYNVLQKLKPSTSIESLAIVNFGGTKFPEWITSLGVENHLTGITISRCKSCKILPPFHRMPQLKFLTLTSMELQHVQDDKSNDGVFFPSLKELKIGRMHSLEGWSRNPDPSKFPDIETMEIWDCLCLKMMPPSTKISQLILQEVTEETLQLIDWTTSCKVEIISIKHMISLPNQFVTEHLQEMTIRYCDHLQRLFEETEAWPSLSKNFQRLRKLSIARCREMKHLSSNLRYLTNLECLTISKCSDELDCLCKEEDGMPWISLKCLRELTIEGFENQVGLPNSLQHLISLETLVIGDCKALKSFPHPFERLEKLSIVNCPAMEHLSSSLRSSINLKWLTLSKCNEKLDCIYKDEEDGMPWKALQKLQKLTIESVEKLVALPNSLLHLPPVELYLTDCKDLKLDVGGLPMSTNIYIKSCPRVSESIEELQKAQLFVVLVE